ALEGNRIGLVGNRESLRRHVLRHRFFRRAVLSVAEWLGRHAVTRRECILGRNKEPREFSNQELIYDNASQHDTASGCRGGSERCEKQGCERPGRHRFAAGRRRRNQARSASECRTIRWYTVESVRCHSFRTRTLALT